MSDGELESIGHVDVSVLGLIAELASMASSSSGQDVYLGACFAEAGDVLERYPEVAVLKEVHAVRVACRTYSTDREASWTELQRAVAALVAYIPDRTFVNLSRILQSVTPSQQDAFKVVIIAFECTKLVQKTILERTAMLTQRANSIDVAFGYEFPFLSTFS